MNEVSVFFLAVGEHFLRFPSEMEPQWIEIDLEKICKIDAVRVKWWGSLAPMTCWVRFGASWDNRNDNTLKLIEMMHHGESRWRNSQKVA